MSSSDSFASLDFEPLMRQFPNDPPLLKNDQVLPFLIWLTVVLDMPYDLAISSCSRLSWRIALASSAFILCAARPFLVLSAMLSECEPKNRCSGLTHAGLSQR